jgi:phospholipase C
MQNFSRLLFAGFAVLAILFLAGCKGLQSPPPSTSSQPFTLTVTMSGGGTGMVMSTPAGINCGSSCSATFQPGTQVTLTATPGIGFQFGGWSGPCSGTGNCVVLNSNNGGTVTATFTASLQSINHIVFMVQENRGFDEYFGALREYWTQNGYPQASQPFEGLPQFNNPAGAAASNPGCDPAFPFQQFPAPNNDCKIDASSPQVSSFKLSTQCVENPSPSWNESHVDWNVSDPLSATPMMDGFVHSAAKDVRDVQYFVPGSPNNACGAQPCPPESDYDGVRVMGYYDWNILPYYYYVASNFAISDHWFSPVMTRTQPNREYLMAATSQGHVYPPLPNSPQLTNRTIFEVLNDNNISWRIYVSDSGGSLQSHTELGMYTFANSHGSNFVPASQFMIDVQNGTLPAVAEIDPGFQSGTDEHAEQDDSKPGGKIQVGAQYVSSLINALMQSPSWKDTVFILTWDEGGGFYDHIPPQPMPSPDGIPPQDLKQPVNGSGGDVCSGGPSTGVTCDFTYTGYRVPLIVISPFTKKNYVSHTVADYTAILKFVETRFGLSPLTNRDAAQMDMSEFFDFTNVPWKTPPAGSALPVQPTNAACDMTTKLP